MINLINSQKKVNYRNTANHEDRIANTSKQTNSFDSKGTPTMVNQFLKSTILFITAPLRYIIRIEVRGQLELKGRHTHQNLEKALAMQATASTAKYIARRMHNIPPLKNKFKLLDLAFSKVSSKTEGIVCEFGVFKGQTINHISTLTSSTVYGFDSFEGLPETWRGGFEKGTFKTEDLPTVNNNVALIKGWFSETVPAFAKNNEQNIKFLHIDCDLYSSTKTILDGLQDKIGPGCVIVFDEYFNYPGWEHGEFKAFHEFVEQNGIIYEYLSYNMHHEQVALIIL